MLLTIVALGSYGDIDPYLTLGRALTTAGHDVRLVTRSEFAGLADGTAMRRYDIAPAPSRATPAATEAGLDQAYRTILAAADGCDALLSHPAHFPALDVAAHLARRVVHVQHTPAEPTGAYPAPTGPAPPRVIGGPGNRASYAVDHWLTWRRGAAMLNRVRGRVLGRPPLPTGRALALRRRRVGAVVVVSPTVLPRPDDWPAAVTQTGYLWSTTAPGPDAPLPPELADFLDAGPAPIVVTLGATPAPEPDRLTYLLVTAARVAGVRLVLRRGPSGLGTRAGDNHVLVTDEVPYARVLPLVAGAVHHGGVGTVAEVLRHGRPSLALPSRADQRFWGRRVALLDAGPSPLPLGRVTVDGLAGRLHALVHNPRYDGRARTLGARIRGEDGTRATVDAVHRLLEGG